MKVRIAQLPVLKDLDLNLSNILRVIEDSNEGEWVIFPEGIVSGYYPEDPNFITELDKEKIDKNLNLIKEKVVKKNIVCIIGSAIFQNENWFNSVVVLSPTIKEIYHKNNLSMLDRRHFQYGEEIKTFDFNGVRFGVQMCRELIFPEQWALLKNERAQVIFHINNAIKITDQKWEHILITRAIENQIWVCSVNNANPPQTLCSMIINPLGEIVWKSVPQKEDFCVMDIDLSTNSDFYHTQKRTDLVKVVRS